MWLHKQDNDKKSRSSGHGAVARIPDRVEQAMWLLAHNLSCEEVAVRMMIRPRSVNSHVHQYCRRTGCTGRTDAITHYAHNRGLSINPAWLDLTPRQRECARLLVAGVWRTADLARLLCIEPWSVQRLLRAMRRRTRTQSKRELVAALHEDEWVAVA